MPWIEAATKPPGMQPRPRAPRPWYEFKNLADDEAELLIYDEIGNYWGTCAEDFVRELRNVTARNLTVRVNSPGGSFFDGATIANALRAHPSTVTVRVEGLCASAASVIAMAGDRIEMAPQTQLMIHDAIGGAYGNAQVMREMVDVLDRISDSIADAYAARAGGTREEWRERTRAETWYSPEEALAAGLIDEAIPMRRRGEEPVEPTPPAEPEMRNSWDLSVFRYAGREHAPAPQVSASAAPVAEPTAAGVTLTADVASLVGDHVANALRAAVAPAPPEPAPAVPAAVATAEDAEAAVTDDPNPQTPAPPQQVVVQVDPAALAAALREADRTDPIEEPAPTPQPAAAPGLAARAAHLIKPARPAAPTWRDRVAHLTPPSSATTQPAP